MKINHFPNISFDISETKEKYLTEKNERIIEELCQVLVEHSKIESDIFLKHQEINTYKKENPGLTGGIVLEDGRAYSFVYAEDILTYEEEQA